MKSNIALIGFMGAGKTAVGRALAAKLNRKFVEMDALIEEKAGKPITDIFRQDGEAAFRKLESEVAVEVSRDKNQVISCGGGVVLNQANVDSLKQGSVLVYLTASPEETAKRTAGDGGKRPLLDNPDKDAVIREMMAFRQPFYKRAADITIDTTELEIDAVVEQIIARTKGNESPHS